MSTSQKALAAAAQARRAAAASVADRRVYRVQSSSQPHHDTHIDQLDRCIAKATRSLNAANLVPAYLGDDKKRRAVVAAANLRAHHAYLKLVAAQEQKDRLLGV